MSKKQQLFNKKATASTVVIRRFMDAANQGDLDAVKRAVEKHPEAVNWRDKSFNTGLHYAAAAGHADIAAFLLDKGADINARTTPPTAWNSVTPLIAAAEWENNIDTVKLLIDRGADLNAATGQGETALMRAAKHSTYPANKGQGEKVLRALVNGGANAALTDADKRTALDIALALGETDAAASIRNAITEKAAADDKAARAEQQGRDTSIDATIADGIATPAAIQPPVRLIKKNPPL